MRLLKNKLKTILIVLNFVVMIGLVVDVVVIRGGLINVGNRVSYVSDTVDVILSEVGTMKSDIEATLEEENSLLEDWNIDVIKTDFNKGTYTVSVEIMPKTYTDTTEAVIYFGTKEHSLKLDGFKFVGKATLPVEENYDGNVTVLFIDGNKKSTEVMSNYVGPVDGWRKVLNGTLSELPTVKDGELYVKADLEYNLTGITKAHKFKEFKMILENSDTEVELLSKDILAESAQESEDAEGESSETEEKEPEAISKLEGIIQLDEKSSVRAGSNVRIYLRAVDEDGYVYEYDLFSGKVLEDEGFEETGEEQVMHSYIKDSKGVFEIPKLDENKDESE